MKIEEYMIDTLNLPYSIVSELQSKYMEYTKVPKPYIMQSHEIGNSQHLDWRMKIDGYLVGWSIVGGNLVNPITPRRLVEQVAKGFRAEEKGRQPISWLKVEGEIKPGQVGAGVEKRGKLTIVSKGQFITGSQKPYFHEYFLKGTSFSNWTRIVVRAIKVKKLDPKTKQPISGRYERMWRVMIPSSQSPYQISDRAMKEKWVPPREIKYAFPKNWVKKKFTKQYRKWLEWITQK